MSKLKWPLFGSYVLLALLFLAALVAYFALPEATWIQDLAPNIAAESVGILLAVFLIDRVIRRRQEATESDASVWPPYSFVGH